MLTIRSILGILNEITDPAILDRPIFAVSKVREIDKGPQEGALVLFTKEACGSVITTEGIFFLTQEQAEERQMMIINPPPGMLSGPREEEEGEDWKKGS
jgi:hypothetical protein